MIHNYKITSNQSGAIKKAALFCLIAAFVVLTTLISTAFAQNGASTPNAGSKPSTVLPADLPVQMSAERLSYNYQTNTYTARGNVSLSQGGTRLRADSIVYEANTGALTAMGGVIVRSGADVIEAEKVTINLNASTGVLLNGKLLLSRHNVYLEGKKLEKKGDANYRVEEGSFTTCDGATPDWRITGKDLDVTLEGYGVLKHGFFYIKDVPVFYLPWLMYPAKRQRQSGFLMPQMANSSIRGFDFRLPLFLDISPSVDMTITPRLCTKRAAQAALEFRYFPAENLRGRFYGEYTYDWKYGPEYDPASHRFYVTWRHDQEFLNFLRLKANANWVSDRNYFEFWGSRFDKRLRVRYLESNAILYSQTNNFLLQTEARHFDNLDVPDNAVTVQNAPILTGTLFARQAPYTPFFVNSSIVYDNYHAPLMNQEWLGSRLQWDSRLALPISLGPYLKFEPSMTYFAKAYAADYYENNKSVSSVNAIRTDLYQINTDVFTDLSSVYSGSALGFQRIKHNIRPRVVWTYRPFRSSQKYPAFDDSDRMDQVSLLTAELRQSWTGRLGPNDYMDFASFSISQGYDFNNSRSPVDPLGQSALTKYNLTNMQAELSIKPHSLLDLRAQAEYDPVMNRARSYSVNLGVMDHRGDTFQILHQFAEDERNEDLNRQTNLNVQLKVTSALDIFFENQYSHQFNFAYFTSVGLNYHPQCWSVLLKYSETREQDPITQRIKDPDQTVFMTVSLYGLGQVYRFSRDWSELLGAPIESSDVQAF